MTSTPYLSPSSDALRKWPSFDNDTTDHFMDANFVPSIKCVLIGDYEVGKTSLINAFATREPLNQYFPGLTGPVQIHIEHLFRLYLLHVHDTEGKHPPSPGPSPAVTPSSEGQDPVHRDLSEASFDDDDGFEHPSSRLETNKWISRRVEYGLADVILICFSLANRTSFEHAETIWRREIQQLCPHIPFLLVGCKLDLRRSDPTTPAVLQSPRPSSTAQFHLRRPRLVRSSTASTSTSATPPTPSEFGHHRSEFSSVSIGTRHPTPSTPAHTSLKPPSSPVPSSDADNVVKKRKSKTFSIPFSPKALRSSSSGTVELMIPLTSKPARNASPSPSSVMAYISQEEHGTGGGDHSSTKAEATKPAPPNCMPKSSRHVSLQLGPRSLSQASVFRRMLSRSQSTTTGDQGQGSPSNVATSASSAADGEPLRRPSLTHRHTSGSTGNKPVPLPHSHVRTNSQPTPVSFSLRSTDAGAPPMQPSSLARKDDSAPLATCSSAVSPSTKLTRIQEPPPMHRYRTTSYQEARRLARRLGASGYMECSALTLVNVVNVFEEAVRVAVERRNASASTLHRRGRRNHRSDECIIV